MLPLQWSVIIPSTSNAHRGVPILMQPNGTTHTLTHTLGVNQRFAEIQGD